MKKLIVLITALGLFAGASMAQDTTKGESTTKKNSKKKKKKKQTTPAK